MVGSVLVERMRAERDFDLIEPVFFSTSQAGGSGPQIGKVTPPVRRCARHQGPRRHGRAHLLPGQRLHRRDLSEAARRRAGTATGSTPPGRCGCSDDAVIVLDPVNLPVIQSALARGHQELHRRQLHGELHADGHARAVRARSRRVDDLHDLPGGLRRRRAAHARAADAVRPHQRRGEGPARRSGAPRSSRSTARCSPSRPTARCRWRISAVCRSPAT